MSDKDMARPDGPGVREGMLRLKADLEGLFVIGGPDRVRLPSGDFLEGEGATTYLALVRAFVGFLGDCAARLPEGIAQNTGPSS
jgi:hypothetical protein